MVEFENKFKEAGLTGNESKVYVELLRRGSTPANELSKKIGMDRTLTYTVLNHLIEKGLVNYIIKDNKKFFATSDPENLLNQIKKKESIIKDLIPILKNIEKVKEVEQEIKIYEGKEGLRVFINLALKEKEFYAFGSTGRAFYALYEMPRIAKKVEKSDIKVKIIGYRGLKGTSAFKFKKMQFRYLNIKSEATTSIFGEYVSIHIAKEKPLIILIKNKDIAESYRNYFELLWKIAKK